MEKSAEKRRREVNHRWTEKETTCLLEAIAQKIEGNPQKFEKPTAQKFYGAVCSKNDAVLKNIAALRANIIKNKMRYWRKTYISAEEWKVQTGAGLLEEGNEQSVKEYVKKICPYYSFLEQIFGLRKNVVLPYNFDSYADCSFDCEAESQESFFCEEVLIESQEEVEKEEVEKEAIGGLKNKLKFTSKERKSNSAMDFLVKSQEKRNELEERKLASQGKMEERRLKLQETLETQKLYLQREHLDFEKQKHQHEFELQKIRLANEMELKKLEMELKLKTK